MIDEAFIELLIGALIELLIEALIEALIGLFVETLIELLVTKRLSADRSLGYFILDIDDNFAKIP